MNIVNTIVYLLVSLFAMLTPIGIILGIVLFVVNSGEQDPVKKKKMKKWAVYCCVLPIVLLFVLVSIWGLISISTGSAVK